MVIRDPRKRMTGDLRDLIFHSVTCIHASRPSPAYLECECQEKVSRVRSTTYLGIVLNEHMKWDEQVRKICGKLRSCLAGLGRIRGQCNSATKRLIYMALADSHLNYAVPVWGLLGKTLRMRVRRLQNKILKLIIGKMKEKCIRKKYKIQTLEEKVVYNLIVQFYWRYDLRENETNRRSARLLQGRRERNYKRRWIRTEYGQKTNEYLIPVIFEALPVELLNFTSINQVKTNIKKFLQTDKGKDLVSMIFA